MTTFTLTELQHSNDRKGPWRLYVYEPNSDYHQGGVWFMAKPKYPEEGEIDTEAALTLATNAMMEGREVRVCDGGDMLVYHAKGQKVLYGANFWSEVLPA